MSKKTLLDIIVDVKDNNHVSEEDLRLAVVMLSTLNEFYRQDLLKLFDKIDTGNINIIQFYKRCLKSTYDSLENAYKKYPSDFLGRENIPGTPENLTFRAMCDKIFKKATGQDL